MTARRFAILVFPGFPMMAFSAVVEVALDTDTIGCYGYYSDFSRTFRAGPHFPRVRRHGVEDSRAFRRPTLYLGDARCRHAWRDAVHRARHGFCDLRQGGHIAAGHGGQRRELYRREEWPRRRQARGGGDGDRD